MTIDLTGGLRESQEHVFAEPPSAPGMRDALNMWISDDRGELGLPRIAVEARAPEWDSHDVKVNVAFPNGRLIRLHEQGKRHATEDSEGRHSILGAGPLQFRCLEPFRRWTASFEGTGIEISAKDDISSSTQSRVELGFHVEASMAVPPWVQGSLSTEAASLLRSSIEGRFMGVVGGYRYEQLFRASGTVRVGDEEHLFTGSGLRIRRVGFKDSSGFWGHCWQSALFPSGRAFGYIAYPPRPDGTPSLNEGFIFEGDGPLIPARLVEAPWFTRMRGSGEDVSLILESERGVHRIEAESVFSVLDHPEALPLYLGGALYSWEGEETYGMIERSCSPEKFVRS